MVSNTLTITKKPKLKYPRSVGFIISNEFCERFNYYGMRTILVLYLTRRLSYDDDTATVLYHIFTSFAYFFPLIGAIIADSYIGRFKTIMYLSIVYVLGSIIITIGAIPPLQLPAKAVTVIGLLLIATGTGGIKPCVSAFGGDQFKIPEQAKQLASFFSLFYFAINAGSLISTSITPILREDVHCFGENDCYSLAFGVPALLMIVSILIFVAGKSLYVMKKPSGNMILSVIKCITEALRKRSSEKNSAPKPHWLDYAEKKYGAQLVQDTKALLKILVLYLPLPVFWALFDQQGSRWTFQATRMIGDIAGGFVLKPDQMQVVNPLLILLFIPLFDCILYPILSKLGIRRPLQKITFGGLLAAAAFVISGFLDLNLEKGYPIIPKSNEAQLRIFNGMPCSYKFQSDLYDIQNENLTIKSLHVYEDLLIQAESSSRVSARFIPVVDDSNSNVTRKICGNVSQEIDLQPGLAMSYFLFSDKNGPFLKGFIENPDKPKDGMPTLRFLANVDDDAQKLQLQNVNDGTSNFINNDNITEVLKVPAGSYKLQYDEHVFGDIDVNQGGSYVYIIAGNNQTGFNFTEYVLAEPNSIHMLWQLPQYIIITAGEVMFSVTGLEFSFTQAPQSMKSVLQACWLLTVAIGNLLVVFIAEFIKFHSQAFEFFAFAALMVLDMGIFILLALRYTYVEHGSTSGLNEGADEFPNDIKIHKGEKVESQLTEKPVKYSNIKQQNGHTNSAYTEDL
ncbi:peptide transporter family 1-like [Condylostylus longicornis]|uniref:peptide transporter family 1-like n=1 Tax=Condylostylus longicornis TaxID=2530218 RepID=UPI00244DD7CB|nr:peptide transporter family 1-like [Condylostylus longicornis]XP_055389661.1 peptide transporter family 1-like [Condylostylus longicornis]XP_055389662.1 peptide transporter family 1-like [Condylostylus longicornis]XP_055389663.1 peptide transporter family 1-like [Condylostylus longicornis]XP_055389664.1 peptide transporter family 1-like [Condylostylus longicornis]XP_055389665.1 peptide transporter family 1-like [Condylostylus longicornis]XP_055389666.1 peptide transporter family 1-like [Con